jgi:glyoxylase I family protein
VRLSVRDPDRSAAWYCDLLGLQRRYDHTSENGARYVCLGDPASGFVLCLGDVPANGGEAFDGTTTGLDHLEFLVARDEELDAWAAHSSELGIPRSGVKRPGYTANGMLTFRDPDNIQLEFFWRASDERRMTARQQSTPRRRATQLE